MRRSSSCPIYLLSVLASLQPCHLHYGLDRQHPQRVYVNLFDDNSRTFVPSQEM